MIKKETEKSLQALLENFNLEFFDGKLAGYKVQIGYALMNHPDDGGSCDSDNKIITIVPWLEPQYYRRVLLHEMIHHEISGHKKDFQTELRRLEAKGEKWAGLEVFRYQYRERLRIIYETIKNKPSWIEARREIVHRLEISAKMLLAIEPGLPKMWRKLKRQYNRGKGGTSNLTGSHRISTTS